MAATPGLHRLSGSNMKMGDNVVDIKEREDVLHVKTKKDKGCEVLTRRVKFGVSPRFKSLCAIIGDKG